MEATEQINKFREFFETYYYPELLENVRKGEKYIILDFNELTKFDPELADILLDQPEEVIKAAEIAIEQFDLSQEAKNFRIRFKNLPESQKIRIRNIRSVHIGKLLWTEGLVRQKSDVRPQVTNARFECPSCGNIIAVLQLEKKFREPTTCGCGRKGRFRLVSKELIDAQGLTLEEAPEDMEGGEQPKRMQVLLKEDLVSPITDRLTNPGSKVILVGVVKEIPLPSKDGGQLTRYDLIIEGNFIETVEEDFTQIQIADEEIEQINEIGNDPKYFEKLIISIAPSIYGHERIKEAILLQMVGGVKKKRTDGVVTRGDVHMLLIGDPGAGKSQLLKRVNTVAPKARFISGKGASGAGLTAAVVKDEFLSGWSLEAGALVLANKGMCCIDELDKMTPEDTSAMHEAMEGQTITISKANIQATLRCETTILAAANPKFGRFDPYDVLAKQINLPSTLINRFDLIFPIKDNPDVAKDTKLATHILDLHQTPEVEEGSIDTELLRKYLIYARQKIKPKITDGAIEEIRNYYVEMRNKDSGDGGVKAVPITARQLEALVRLTEANAKLRLSPKADRSDAKRAVDILHFCLSQIGIDPETGKFDIDRISTGITTTERSKIVVVREIINELENKIGKMIPVEDVVEAAAAQGLDESQVEESIEKLKRSGDIFEPSRGMLSKI